MAEADELFDDEAIEVPSMVEDIEKAKKDVASRCKQADLAVEEVRVPDEDRTFLRVGMKRGRDVRWLTFFSDEEIAKLSSIKFENYVFLGEYDAICCYQEGSIEAAVEKITPSMASTFRRVFSRVFNLESTAENSYNFSIEPPQANLPRIELSHASHVFTTLLASENRFRPTLKLFGCQVTAYDRAVALLAKTADSLFFQIDLLSDVSFGLQRERTWYPMTRRPQRKINLATELQYPKTEFDEAPVSLYWYARGAAGMPLLQFLAFYQVIEFYFPTYSRAEAHRKLKAILKDPTFRGDRDTDVGKLLSAIYVNKSGSFGDERSQLRATLAECADANALRTFLECAPERKEFYQGKGKASLYHKIPLANASADLRNDVADRIYDIRCKIVHSKNGSREGEVEFLLPFSKEAAQLGFDIELVQYLAQLVLVAGSTPFSA